MLSLPLAFALSQDQTLQFQTFRSVFGAAAAGLTAAQIRGAPRAGRLRGAGLEAHELFFNQRELLPVFQRPDRGSRPDGCSAGEPGAAVKPRRVAGSRPAAPPLHSGFLSRPVLFVNPTRGDFLSPSAWGRPGVADRAMAMDLNSTAVEHALAVRRRRAPADPHPLSTPRRGVQARRPFYFGRFARGSGETNHNAKETLSRRGAVGAGGQVDRGAGRRAVRPGRGCGVGARAPGARRPAGHDRARAAHAGRRRGPRGAVRRAAAPRPPHRGGLARRRGPLVLTGPVPGADLGGARHPLSADRRGADCGRPRACGRRSRADRGGPARGRRRGRGPQRSLAGPGSPRRADRALHPGVQCTVRATATTRGRSCASGTAAHAADALLIPDQFVRGVVAWALHRGGRRPPEGGRRPVEVAPAPERRPGARAPRC